MPNDSGNWIGETTNANPDSCVATYAAASNRCPLSFNALEFGET